MCICQEREVKEICTQQRFVHINVGGPKASCCGVVNFINFEEVV